MRTWIVSKVFWLRTLERALKSAAEGALVYLGGGQALDLWSIDVEGLAGASGGMFLVTVLVSMASTTVGDPEDPSIID